MPLSSWEIAVWIFVAILVIGVITYIVGLLSKSSSIESIGKNTGCVALSGLIVVYAVYYKVKKVESERQAINALGNYLSK